MRLGYLLLLLGVLFSAGIAAAQDSDLSETYAFESGATFNYPGDWTLRDDPQYLLDIYSDRTIIYFIDVTQPYLTPQPLARLRQWRGGEICTLRKSPYAPYAPGSCLGTGTVNIPLDFAPERYSVSSASSSYDGERHGHA